MKVYPFALHNWLMMLCLLAYMTPISALHSLKEAQTAALVIHAAHPYTFFCDSPISPQGYVKAQDCAHCQPYDTKIKWLHIVPPQVFAKHLDCYVNKRCVNTKGQWFKGKSCCMKQSPLFKSMSLDLLNWVPETEALAKLRRVYAFASSEHNLPYECTFSIDKKKKTIHIKPELLGFIARTYLYMMTTYGIELSAQEKEQYHRWHQDYPPSDWERLRNQKIKALQGYGNPWIE